MKIASRAASRAKQIVQQARKAIRTQEALFCQKGTFSVHPDSDALISFFLTQNDGQRSY
ncbi:hypothetical protein [Paenibacillus sonchi]|uniref:hypothetical protein n=1 Tax=Paenibacillus sonchi TaxID=373687 RepID=UPI0012FD5634|nr:hypothetical protein [Paenibacillus sonchi]